MSNGLKQCRVCGKWYKACTSHGRRDTTFRWQLVSCSPECGSIYLQRITDLNSKHNNDSVSTIPEDTNDIYIPDDEFDDEELDDEIDYELDDIYE